MPGGLTLLESLNADIPTPPTGKVTVFFSIDLGVPAYKDDAGTVTTLVGAGGATGAAGPQGPIGFADNGEDGDFFIALPGATGNPGATGPQGPVGPMMVVSDGIDGEDGQIIPPPPSGAIEDAWTYVEVNGGSDFTTTSGTAVNVTGLAFTPEANKIYEFEIVLMCRSSATSSYPQVGLAWPTGITDAVGRIQGTGSSAVAAPSVSSGNFNTALLLGAGTQVNNTQSWPTFIQGYLVAGATPSGDVQVQLLSETAGQTSTIKAKSFLKYREVTF